MVIFHSYVNLLEGSYFPSLLTYPLTFSFQCLSFEILDSTSTSGKASHQCEDGCRLVCFLLFSFHIASQQLGLLLEAVVAQEAYCFIASFIAVQSAHLYCFHDSKACYCKWFPSESFRDPGDPGHLRCLNH